MKTNQTFSFLFLLGLMLLFNSSFGQVRKNWSTGVFFNYETLTPHVNTFIGDKWHVYSTGSNMDGFQIGAHFQLNTRKNWYWRTQLSYFQSSSFLQYVNLKWQDDLALYGWATTIGSGAYKNNMLRLQISRGYRIAKNLSVDVSGNVALQFKDNFLAGKPDSYFDPASPAKGDITVHRFADGFTTFVFLGSARANYYFGPLTISFTLDKSFTSLSKGVEYEQQIYPVNYQISTWSIGLAYQMYKNHQ